MEKNAKFKLCSEWIPEITHLTETWDNKASKLIIHKHVQMERKLPLILYKWKKKSFDLDKLLRIKNCKTKFKCISTVSGSCCLLMCIQKYAGGFFKSILQIYTHNAYVPSELPVYMQGKFKIYLTLFYFIIQTFRLSVSVLFPLVEIPVCTCSCSWSDWHLYCFNSIIYNSMIHVISIVPISYHRMSMNLL